MKKKLSHEKKLAIIRSNGGTQKDILSILLELQNAVPEGYIDRETAALVGQELELPESKVYEIATFYSMLKTKPQAKNVFKICNSSPCHFSKSDTIKSLLEEELNIKIGETTADHMFSFHYIPCVGACDIGPIIKLKDTVYGNLDKDKIKQIINNLKNENSEQVL